MSLAMIDHCHAVISTLYRQYPETLLSDMSHFVFTMTLCVRCLKDIVSSWLLLAKS